jgi:hypothetical protein
VPDGLRLDAAHHGRRVGCNNGLRVGEFGERGEAHEKAAQMVWRQAVLGLLECNQGETGRSQARGLHRRDLAGKHSRADLVQCQDHPDVQQGLLAVAQPAPRHQGLLAGRRKEPDVEVPQQFGDVGAREVEPRRGEVRPAVEIPPHLLKPARELGQ